MATIPELRQWLWVISENTVVKSCRQIIYQKKQIIFCIIFVFQCISEREAEEEGITCDISHEPDLTSECQCTCQQSYPHPKFLYISVFIFNSEACNPASAGVLFAFGPYSIISSPNPSPAASLHLCYCKFTLVTCTIQMIDTNKREIDNTLFRW